MEAFGKLKTKVSSAGRPSFCKGESELLQQDGIGFYDREARNSHETGTLYLTTHRLVWVEDTATPPRRGLYVALADLETDSVTRWTGVPLGSLGFGHLSHPKLVITLTKAASDRCKSGTLGKGKTAYFKVSFRKYGMEGFRTALLRSLKKKAWTSTAIKSFDVLDADEEAKAKPTQTELLPESATVLEGGVQVVTQKVGAEGALTALTSLDKTPMAKAVFTFISVANGPHDTIVHYSPSDTERCVALRANNAATTVLRLPPNSSSYSTTLVLGAGKNTLVVSQSLRTDLQLSPPEAVHKLVLKPLASSPTHAAQASGKQESGTRLGGITGIVGKYAQADATEEARLNDAVQDIDVLMGMASEISELVTQLQKKVSAQSSKGSTGEQDEIAAQQEELNSWVAELGLSSIVTKDSVGQADYATEVAKQLLDFLPGPLARQNGTMSIVDAWCLYNKARGSDLVSPEDMYKACKKLPTLHGSIIQCIEVRGLHLLRLDDVAGDAKLLSLLEDSTVFVTPLSLSAELKVSARVATEILTDAENRGLVVIDAQHAEGVVYYKNLFQKS